MSALANIFSSGHSITLLTVGSGVQQPETWMIIAGYVASVLIGLSLGLIGGGGSILTLPVLVYLLGVDPVTATAYSLFIVGFTALVGTWPKYKQGEVDIKTALIFGAPSIVAVFLTRKLLVPAIPNEIFSIGEFTVTKSILMMLIFAVLMVFASVSMIRKPKPKTTVNDSGVLDTVETTEAPKAPMPAGRRYLLIGGEGVVVGTLTGLVGAGGGFLIIPALVLFCGLSMKTAVGTSLLVIAAKSLIGFTGDLGKMQPDWTLLLAVTALAVGGIFIGNILAKKIDGNKLKTGFGWFVLVMGIYIILKELVFK